ncbi:response regulator [Azospirillum sp.]|uniref:response regulator n=1 Tax=Azospirillum sp. TaxID=34012 RepID=UPI003D706DCE
MAEHSDQSDRMAARILIAEDSATQAAQLTFLLEERGFDVLAARDGRKALAMAEQHHPDLVIADIVMPELDGYGLCAAIKADAALRGTPVILVTELSSPHDVFRGLNAGADNFIIKPFDENVLLSRIRYLLTNRELRKSGKLQLGIEIELSGQRHFITAERQQILDLLISTYEQAVRLNDVLESRQKALTRSYDTLNALYHLADDLNRCQTAMDVGVSALERGLKLPGVRAGWIFLRDGDDGFRLLASNGAPSSLFVADGGCSRCICQQGLLSGTLSGAANIVECERLAKASDAGDLRFHASVPLIADGVAIGLLNLVGAEKRMFSDEELRTLAGVGNQIATSLARALLHEDLERKVAERTRELREEVVERREAEAAARLAAAEIGHANRTISAILEASPVAIITMDGGGRVSTWNQAAETIFGRAADAIIGHPYPFEPGNGPRLETILARLAAGEILRGAEHACRRSDGTMVSLRGSFAPMLDPAGGFRGAVLVVEDVTERKRVEEQLRQSQKMEALGKMTGGMAHDFNNLLTVVIGNLDLLSELLDDRPDAAELADSALQASLRGAELTRQLLAFSRCQPLAPETVDVNHLLRGMVRLLGRTLGEPVEIRLIEGAGVWPVRIDPAQLDSVIVNLAVNARDAMPDGGRLIIETRNQTVDQSYGSTRPDIQPGDYAVVEVTDTGIGMLPEVMARIFEPFFTTKPLHKGTGLGLAMVYGFAKQSGGHIGVYSEPGIGTRFSLYLPRDQAAEAMVAAAEHPPEPPRSRGHETILVVEDNVSVRQMVTRQIAELGYGVLAAADAQEGLTLLAGHERVDLLFSDIVMPGDMNGLGLAREAARRRPGLKIVLTSGFSEEGLDRHIGPAEYAVLTKPYRKNDLAETLRQALDSQGTAE